MYATVIAMLIAGLWHGADWRFLIFGGMHGLGLVANHIWKKRKLHMPFFCAWALTFLWVDIAFVFFRARSWNSVERMFSAMLGFNSIGTPNWQALIMLALAFMIIFLAPNTEQIQSRVSRGSLQWVLGSGVALAVAICVLEFDNANEFLYFKF